ncbi:MAG: SPOR domain-containing protein [Treponema sp.]|nr:SPOR domain-containing protein [Treponema sp.]
MKKITLFILTIFTVATLFAAARPSLDGRAVVADSGSMPRGLFARTVGYLPGDSVTVTNPATGSTVDVLILGAIDPSEGVAILLSPEAADGLRIRPDSNVQVKLTKRSGSLDENANGSAVLSDVADEAAAKSVEVSAEIPETMKGVVAEPSPESNPEPDYEEFPAVPEENKELAAVAPVEESPVIASIPAQVVEEKNELEPLYEEVPAIQEETLEKVVDDSLNSLPADDEKLQKVVLVEEEPAYPEEKESEIVEVVEEKKQNLDEPELASIVQEEELPPLDEEVKEVAVVSEEIAEEKKSEDAPLADAYQPIILVPAEPNPPVVEEIAELEPSVEVAESAEVAEVAEKSETPEVTEVVEVIPAVVEEKSEKSLAEKKPLVSNDWTNYVVPSLKNLRSGSYYIQVASLGNTDNIKNFVDKYSCKYPIVLVQNSGKTVYQMMVGPLNIDEYGSVDEKFKAYGFKDAFVRKIK